MQKLFDKTGVMAIGSRLRMISQRINNDALKIFKLYGVDIKPKWYPVVYTLLDGQSKTVTSIANEIGHSHVSVVKIIKEMSKAKMLVETKDTSDRRKINISLSPHGKEVVKGLEYQHQDVTLAMQKMVDGMEHNLWLALGEFESLLDEQSTYPRVVEEQRKREAKHIEVVAFDGQYKDAFKSLNSWWIEEYFEMESKDAKILNNPQESIIDQGGIILIALYDNQPVGTCALLKLTNSVYDYELSKMGIDRDFHGKGIGKILANSIINQAKSMGAKSLFIETNAILEPAIALYKSVGFKEIENYTSSYGRSNYFLEFILTEAEDDRI